MTPMPTTPKSAVGAFMSRTSSCEWAHTQPGPSTTVTLAGHVVDDLDVAQHGAVSRALILNELHAGPPRHARCECASGDSHRGAGVARRAPCCLKTESKLSVGNARTSCLVHPVIGGRQRRCFPPALFAGGQQMFSSALCLEVASADVFLRARLGVASADVCVGGPPLCPAQTFSSTLCCRGQSRCLPVVRRCGQRRRFPPRSAEVASADVCTRGPPLWPTQTFSSALCCRGQRRRLRRGSSASPGSLGSRGSRRHRRPCSQCFQRFQPAELHARQIARCERAPVAFGLRA